MNQDYNKQGEVALLLTFLGDSKLKSLANSPNFNQYILDQKKLISSFLQTGLEIYNSSKENNNFSFETKTPIVETAKSSISNLEELTKEITAIFADKTGYPIDMLEPDLDLEADLGIDTVKHMELLNIIKDQFPSKIDGEFSLRDTPTISAIAKSLSV